MNRHLKSQYPVRRRPSALRTARGTQNLGTPDTPASGEVRPYRSSTDAPGTGAPSFRRAAAHTGLAGLAFLAFTFTAVLQLLPYAQADTCAAAPSGLVSWFRAEGDLRDNQSGAIAAKRGTVDFAPGHTGQAFVFRGGTGAVVMEARPELQLQRFTIEAWIRRDQPDKASDAEGFGTIISHGAGGYLLAVTHDGRPSIGRPGETRLDGPPLIADTAWHHVAATHDGTTTVLYVDGAKVANGSITGSFQFNGPPAIGALGSDNAGSYNAFLGLIDEVSIYSRALASDEVHGLFDAGGAGKCVPPAAPCVGVADLTAWWSLDGALSEKVLSLDATGGTPFSYVGGKVGSGIHFSGQGGLSITNSPALRLTNLTVEMWLRRDDVAKASTNGFFGTLVAGGTDAWNFSLLGNGALSFGRTDHSRVDSAPVVTDLNWHHVAVTKKGTTVTFYVDGTPAGSHEFDPGFLYTTPFGIGAIAPTGRNALVGTLDEVTIFQRALEPAEIASIHLAGTSGKCFRDVAITIDRAPGRIAAGQLLDLGFTVQNRSGDPAEHAKVQFDILPGFGLAVFVNPAGGCSVANGTVTCDLGTLAGGASVSIALSLKSPAGARKFQLSPRATSDSFDAVPANDRGLVDVEMQASCIDALPDLAGWWRGEVNVDDFTGRQVAVGQGGLSASQSGRVGATLLYDGASQVRVDAPHTFGGGQLTFAAWVNPSADNGAVEIIGAIDAGTSAEQLVFALGIRGRALAGGDIPTGDLCFKVGGFTNAPSEYAGWTDARASIPQGKWSHVALVIDSTNHTLSAIVNGTETRRITLAEGTLNSTAAPFYIGARSEAYHDAGASADRFNGSIDEVMVFNRALAASELKAINDAADSGFCADDVKVTVTTDIGTVAPLGQEFRVTVQVTNAGARPAAGIVITNRIPDLLEIRATTNSHGTFVRDGYELRTLVPLLRPGEAATLGFTVAATNASAGDWLAAIAQTENDVNAKNNRLTQTIAAQPVTVSGSSTPANGQPNEGNGVLEFTLAVFPPSKAPVVVDYTTTGITAAAGIDFLPVTSSVTFAPGITNATVLVPLVNDPRFEPAEEVHLALTKVAGAVAAASAIPGFIVSDDPLPSVSIGDVRFTERSTGQADAVLRLRLSAPSDSPVTVKYATTNETAKAPFDYLAASGLVTFPAGSIEQSIPVAVVGDSVPEPNEFFAVALSEPSGATIQDGRGIVAIINDDGIDAQLARLKWELPSNLPPLSPGSGVDVLLTALDLGGSTIGNFTGIVGVSAYAGSGNPAGIIISEVFVTAQANHIEFQNVSTTLIEAAGWTVTLFDATKWPVPQATFVVPSGNVIPPRGVFTLNDGTTALGTAVPRFALGSKLTWAPATSDPLPPRRIGIVLQDAEGRVMDTFFADGASPSELSAPVVLTDRDWNGRPLPRTSDRSRAYQRTGQANFHDATRWEISTEGSIGRSNTNLFLPFLEAAPVAVEPSSVADFSGGEFFGTLQIQGFAPVVRLHADDGNGHTGISGPLFLTTTNDVAVRIETTTLASTGERLDYAVTVTNPGPAIVSNLVLSVNLDTGVRAGSVTNLTNSTGPAPTAAGVAPAYTVTANFDPISPGTTARVTFSATAGGTASSIIESIARARITAAPTDANLVNNVATAATEISAPCKSQSASEISWWTASDGAMDLAGTNHGVLRGSLSTADNGRVGPGFHFGDATAVLEIPDAGGLDLPARRTFSWDFWIRTDASESRDDIHVFSKRDPVTRAGYSFRIVNGLATFALNPGVPGGAELVTTADQANLVDLRNGRWHHVVIAVVRDTNNFIRLLVDGKECRTSAQALAKVDVVNASPIRFGAESDSESAEAAAFIGDLDEVALWPDDATSRASTLYVSGGHGRCSSAMGLSITYPLPSGAGGTPPGAPAGILGAPYRFTVLVTNSGPFTAYAGRVRATSDVPFQVVGIDAGAGATGGNLDALSAEARFAVLPARTTLPVTFLISSTNARVRIGFKTGSDLANITHGNAAAMTVPLLVDADGDGMDDAWESANSLNPADPSDAGTDADADGHSNLAEYRLKTNPSNATSGLTLKMTTQVDGSVLLQFPAQANRQYQVVRRARFNAGDWEVLQDFVSTKAQSRSFTDSAPPASGALYAVRVVP